jgi:chemotaxis protein methyltransferase CheR
LAQEQIEILAGYLTISESYFWREPHVFDALRDQILPDLIRARKENRRLRIWSAGCATGEEPYSIAIALRQILPDLEDWHITLLATDINPKVLRRASAGVYGNWSFRNVPPDFKERYFSATEDGKFEIDPKIRKMVTFAYLNLSDDVFPSLINNTNAMDIIFCRNVLMYFAPALICLVGERFHQSLVEGGWFIVSSSELSQHVFEQFSTVNFPGAIAYRHENNKAKPMAAFPFALPPARRKLIEMLPVVGVRIEAHKTRPREAVSPIQPIMPEKVLPPPDIELTVRALANLGKLAEAWSACEQAIAVDKLNPGLYYLDAIILQEQNQDDEAMTAFKRALYLEPNFIMAHFSMGNLLLRRGNMPAAKKSFKNVMTLLSEHGQDETLLESEGLTAGRIKQIIRATLQTGALTTL